MSEKIDHTAEIFTALGITPETQPEIFDEFYTTPHLTDGTLESDGLAVRLVEIARKKRLISSPQYAADLEGFTWAVHPNNIVIPSAINTSFAAAVHDALCEALGITEEGKI